MIKEKNRNNCHNISVFANKNAKTVKKIKEFQRNQIKSDTESGCQLDSGVDVVTEC